MGSSRKSALGVGELTQFDIHILIFLSSFLIVAAGLVFLSAILIAVTMW